MDILGTYDLPELPDETDENDDTVDTVELMLFRQDDANLHLGYVTRQDAQEYASRDDTHGDGWFVGFMAIY